MKAQAAPEVKPAQAAKQPPGTPPHPGSESSLAPSTPAGGPAEPVTPEPVTATMEVENLSAAHLLDLVSRMSFTEAGPAAPRQLGSTEYSKQAPAWRTGARAGSIMPERNTFEGMMAPVRTEVIDRWQAADGSNNVVINTPNGDTLCGRAEAWNPMQPLVEHLMMFGTCVGGGKRTFTMAKRELR